MFCKNCGRQLGEGENFCPSCGAMNAAESNANANTGFQYDLGTANTDAQYSFGAPNSVSEALKSEMAGQTFKWGLLGLIFSGTVCLSLLGFIFSIIAKSKAKSYKRAFGTLEGRAKAGNILGKIGFGLGLGMMIYFAVCFFIGIALGLSGVDAEYTYWLF